MRPTLVIFSGLPGTGKSSLAERLAGELHWPLLRIDDMAACMPAEMDHSKPAFWDQSIAALLLLAKTQLELGTSVIADSIFMNLDRYHARAIARETSTRFVPVHTFVSDEAEWEKRVRARSEGSNRAEGAATWEQVLAQKKSFRPWEEGTALFVDGIRPVEENYPAVRDCACDPKVEFQPLEEAAFTPGRYHR
jgi:predicted kinase